MNQATATTAPVVSDLRPIARRAMRDAGFAVELSTAAQQEAQAAAVDAVKAAVRDLRSLLWSSIDNTESRDLDQIEWAEKLPNDVIRLLVGIADVDALAPRGSAHEAHAFANTTSVNTGV
jgi:exoribonuclease-2